MKISFRPGDTVSTGAVAPRPARAPGRGGPARLSALPALAALAMTAVLAALGAPAPAQVFADVSHSAGTAAEHVDAQLGFTMSGGVAWLDMDADGDDDLLLTQGHGAHRLFENRAAQGEEGFVDATDGAGLLGLPNNFGVAVGDYDQDGLPDVLVTNHGANQIFHNEGGGEFRDVTVELGIALPGMSTSAAWADFDLDGDLDFYVGNYIEELDFPYHVGGANELWINAGTPAAPQFVNRAAELGVDGATVFGPPHPLHPEGATPGAPTSGCTLSVCTLDYDQDGDPDILVGNDFGMFVSPNRVFRNDYDPELGLQFTDVSDETNVGAFPQYNMGINPCDFDHDGDWDLYLSDLGGNLLLRNDEGVFHDVTEQAGPVEGLSADGDLLLTSWGTLWIDYDNDGWEDLYVVNGHIPAAGFIANEWRAPNALWRNLGDGTFTRLTASASGADDDGIGRGVAMSDFDLDGRMDFHLVNNDAPGLSLPHDACRLFHNQLGDADGAGGGSGANRWLQLRLTGTASNVEGLGTRVQVLLAGGLPAPGDGAPAGEPALLMRELRADPVYLSSPTRMLHFGLGPHPRASRVTLAWPSGHRQELYDVHAGRHEIVEPLVVPVTLHAPRLVGSGLQFTLTVSNRADEVRPYSVDFSVRFGHVVVLSDAVRGELLPGETARASTTVPLAAALLGVLGGQELELHAVVTDPLGRTFDERKVAFALD